MTEVEWLLSSNPSAMLRSLDLPDELPQGRSRIPSNRKLRLFACACARLVWHHLIDDAPCDRCNGHGELPDPSNSGWLRGGGTCPDCHGTDRISRSRRAVEVAERFADNLVTLEELEDANIYASVAASYTATTDVFAAVANLTEVDIDITATLNCIATSEANKAAILRDIVGNPFRPVELPRCSPWLTWNDCTVPKLARSIYDARAWDEMPILADALEEAGCDNEEILRHCRGQERCPRCLRNSGWGVDGTQADSDCLPCKGTGWIPLLSSHVRGCWVLDLLLEKP